MYCKDQKRKLSCHIFLQEYWGITDLRGTYCSKKGPKRAMQLTTVISEYTETVGNYCD